MLKPGTPAPDFTLPDQNGRPVRLPDLLQDGPLVLYFYPKDNTPGCTAEACGFRDRLEDFRHLQARVAGVSADSPDTHRQFADRYSLPFVLLSDSDNRVRQLYRVPATLPGLIPGRATYVISRSGIITAAFNHQLRARQHVAEALEALKNNSF